MQNYKRTFLSLAVAGIISGTTFNPVYSAALTVKDEDDSLTFSGDYPTSGNLLISDNDTLEVISGVTIYSDGSNPALTIDVEEDSSNDSAAGSLVLGDPGIVINGNLDGTRQSAAGDGSGTQAGLKITDSNGSNDSLESNITINGNIFGGMEGVISDVAITGNITVGETSIITGNTGIDFSSATITGNFTNAGTVKAEGGSSEYAIWLDDVSGDVRNSGMVEGSEDGDSGLVISGTVGGTVVNTSTIKGHDTALSINDAVSNGINNFGILEGTGGSGIALKIGGAVSSGIENSGTLLATGSSGTALSVIETVTGTFVNSGTIQGNTAINVADSKSVTIDNTGVVNGIFNTNTSGTLNFTNKSGGQVTSDTMGVSALTNESGGGINVSGILTIGANSSNAGSMTAETFVGGSHTFDNTGTADFGVYTGTGDLTNTGSLTIKQGATSGDYSQTGGSLTLDVTDGISTVFNPTAASFGSNSSLKINVVAGSLTTAGALNGGGCCHSG